MPHIGQGGKQNTLYMGIETIPQHTRFEALRRSPKRTISARSESRPLQPLIYSGVTYIKPHKSLKYYKNAIFCKKYKNNNYYNLKNNYIPFQYHFLPSN